MANTPHDFTVTLSIDGRTVAKRSESILSYNDNVVYSLRINTLMKDIIGLIEEALKDESIKKADNLINNERFWNE